MKKETYRAIIYGLLFVAGLHVYAETELLDGAEAKVALLQEGNPVEWTNSVTVRETGGYAYRIVFNKNDAKKYDSLTLKKPLEAIEVLLNGKPVPLPMKEGMFYETVPGIPASMLKEGVNVITCETFAGATMEPKKRKNLKGKEKVISMGEAGFSLKGLVAGDLALQTGPVLGWAGQNHITLSCRVNMPAEVQLIIGDKTFGSQTGLMHKFKADELEADTEYSYVLKGKVPGSAEWVDLSKPNMVRTYPTEGKLEFVIMGDSRSRPKDWARVAKSVVERDPLFCAFGGDMVMRGYNDALWDANFFGRAKEFFATVPFYGLLGNHEERSVLFTHLFPTPSGTPVWDQKIGSVHMIAIDGEQEWVLENENIQSLETLLATTDAKFIFLCTHYPAWTSGKHGKIRNGITRDRHVLAAREVIAPLLEKYRATAMVAGHDHCYERSETPGGLTVIVTGGAGAPLTDRFTYEDGTVQNPYSKVFISLHHYCWFSVEGDTCTMTTITPEGKILDTRTWNARKTEAL